ncbi:MAG: hypothetical protein PW734_08685 [Verrucomicrobium sp.]|nr:hypothetical protein [Verrucomicrobium sp.]
MPSFDPQKSSAAEFVTLRLETAQEESARSACMFLHTGDDGLFPAAAGAR